MSIVFTRYFCPFRLEDNGGQSYHYYHKETQLVCLTVCDSVDPNFAFCSLEDIRVKCECLFGLWRSCRWQLEHVGYLKNIRKKKKNRHMDREKLANQCITQLSHSADKRISHSGSGTPGCPGFLALPTWPSELRGHFRWGRRSGTWKIRISRFTSGRRRHSSCRVKTQTVPLHFS